MSWAESPSGPWSDPVDLEEMYSSGVNWGDGDHNLVFTINGDGSVNGLMRRCCQPPELAGANAWTSWIYTVYADNWRDATTWRTNATPAFGPDTQFHGYEDPHIWPDVRRPGAYHAVIHNMVGSNHHAEVGLHAYSADAGRSWTSTGIAFNRTLDLTDGSTLECMSRERPTMILNENGLPTHLLTACKYVDDMAGTSRSMMQPIGSSSVLTV